MRNAMAGRRVRFRYRDLTPDRSDVPADDAVWKYSTPAGILQSAKFGPRQTGDSISYDLSSHYVRRSLQIREACS